MGEPQNDHFYDLEISGRVPKPQNKLFLSLEAPGYLDNFNKIPWNISQISKHPEFVELQSVDTFRKAGTGKWRISV